MPASLAGLFTTVDTIKRGECREDQLGFCLKLVHADICGGRRVRPLPEELERPLMANAGYAVNLDEAIEGDVAL